MDYEIKIDGKWTPQTTMFSRGDMAFWAFSAHDVRPPAGHVLTYLANGDPYFKTLEQPGGHTR